ncbi:hypothetical protein M430DRAFT_33354 [Amorphotheca resinae ATCC 22711]|uniref:FAD/NAD(P)-binding domain-containing protein n=1 Tax=Amorphotheca resinae ATCC 22711 TaxID=857342 RepID=A0A2T3BBR3_AMORE|nr:hypothetical protein M430DRAFT_33354 [Amorphotheca resinae ATCC 22711]PSS25761.1 hypothetical protein M430DRAFT_33354 [Amorphotheca resinae ATCC 22711]
MSKTILILGASYAGLATAHILLKKTLPTLKDYKVVLVSPTTHMYWNLASPRAIVPGQFGDEKVFGDIESGFKKYPAGSFEFIVGTASSLDPETKAVSITTAAGETRQAYDVLVLATGTRTIGDLPWKSSVKGYEATKEILHKYRDQVKTAKSIVLGGGGPTGAETAGELGFEFRKSKEITLITSAPELCADSLPVNIAKVAEKELQKLHVKIVKGVKITGVKPTEDGKTELTLDNGETKITDLYLPTVGVLPNSEYVPKALLNEKGYVIVDQHLRVKNATDIWAAGDIIDIEPSQLVYCEKQATALAKNLDLTLKGKEPVPYKTGGDRVLGLTLGRSKATGRAGNKKIPSFIIWFLKGRTLGTQNLPAYISGSKF